MNNGLEQVPPVVAFYVTAAGVTVICYSKDNVLEWVEWIMDRGLVPVIRKEVK